jgi:glucokinase
MGGRSIVTVLAYDVGGTRIKAGLVDAGRVTSSATVATDRSGTAADVIDQIVTLGREVAGTTTPDAIGISMKGLVDPESGVLVEINPPLACLTGQPVAAMVAAEFQLPVKLDNDARMYALGELRHGAGRGVSDLVCLTLGTGIGSGVAVGGRMLRGPRGALGILGGHFTIAMEGPPCGCGNVGCIEALIGSDALVAYAADQLRAGVPSELVVEELDPAALFSAAGRGDRVAAETVRRFTVVLSGAVVTMIHAYDPELVVLGGGLSGSAAQFLPQLREYVRERAWTYPKGRVRVEVSELGDSAALLGAAELARDEAWAW